MGDSSGYTECKSCGERLPADHQGACPECGNRAMKEVIQRSDTASLSESWTTHREYFNKKPWVLAAGIALDCLLGLVALKIGGILAAILAAVVGGVLIYSLFPPIHERFVKSETVS